MVNPKIIFTVLLLMIYYLVSAQDSAINYYTRAKDKYLATKFCEAVKDMDTFISMHPSDTAYLYRAQLKFDCGDVGRLHLLSAHLGQPGAGRIDRSHPFSAA